MSPSGEATRRPVVGALLDALDAALTAAWDDDAFVEALAHDEELVGTVAGLEFAIEVLRTALGGVERPDPSESAVGNHE